MINFLCGMKTIQHHYENINKITDFRIVIICIFVIHYSDVYLLSLIID